MNVERVEVLMKVIAETILMRMQGLAVVADIVWESSREFTSFDWLIAEPDGHILVLFNHVKLFFYGFKSQNKNFFLG